MLDGVVQDAGIYLIPPDARANTQRVFVPRAAMENFEILALLTLRRKSSGAGQSSTETGESEQKIIQSPLFEEAPASPDKRGVHAKR